MVALIDHRDHRKILHELEAPLMDLSQIDVETVELIHRIEEQQDGYVGLVRKISDGDFQPLASVKASSLREHLPELLPYLFQDSYFTVNGFYRPQHWKNKHTGFDEVFRAEEGLRYLNACYADLDYYKSDPPLKWPEAVARVLEAQEQGIIPPASIIARSGRGIYLFWLLVNHRAGGMQRAFPQEVTLYKQIHKQIQRALNSFDERLNCDSNATDAARVLRLPGSTNSKSKESVRYIVQATERGLAPAYSLSEMANKFGLKDCSYHGTTIQGQDFYETVFENGRRIKKRGSAPNRIRGKVAVEKYRLQDLEAIEQDRGGFEKGMRRRTIRNFAYWAKVAGMTLPEILDGAKAIASRCRPPYPSDKNDTPIRMIVDEAWLDSTKVFRSDRLAKFFGIDDATAERLNLKSIVPPETRKRRNAAPSERALKREMILDSIRDYFKTHGATVPTCRDLSGYLTGLGLPCSHETARKYTNAVLAEIRGKNA